MIFITILAWWQISAHSIQPHLYYHTFNNLLGRVINLSEFAKDCPDFKTESLRNLFKSKQIRVKGHPAWRYPGLIFLLLIYCCVWCWGASGNLRMFWGDSLVVQWLGFCTSTEGDVGLLLGRVTKILHAAQKREKKKRSFVPYEQENGKTGWIIVWLWSAGEPHQTTIKKTRENNIEHIVLTSRADWHCQWLVHSLEKAPGFWVSGLPVDMVSPTLCHFQKGAYDAFINSVVTRSPWVRYYY